ncbi:MAG: hypothetical protein WC806_03275 [Candidatus Gracilibacteria bacterium]|jgi:dihydrofolate synthase/folylpolyglutamate synthase
MNFESAYSFLKKIKSYEDLVFVKYNKKNFNLDRVRKFLKAFFAELDNVKIVHVAGSKGKGSVCNMVAQCLVFDTFDEVLVKVKVGMFTSPYIFSVRECFWVDGKIISEKKFCEYVYELKIFLKKYKGESPTYFEALMGLVFKYFIDCGVNIAVVEVGMGGRMDATNVVLPEVCALTFMEEEHKGIIGNNLSEILDEKLGIYKKNVPFLIGKQNKNVYEMIKNKMRGKKEIIFVDEKNIKNKDENDFYDNARLASAILKKLISNFDENNFNNFLKTFKLVGRFDVRKYKGKNIVFDIAHTKNSMKNLVFKLKQKFSDKKFVFLVSLMIGKDVKNIIKIIANDAYMIGFCKSHEIRSESPEKLFLIAQKLGAKRISFCEGFAPIYKDFLQDLKKDQVLVVTGSHFLVSKAMKDLNYSSFN